MFSDFQFSFNVTFLFSHSGFLPILVYRRQAFSLINIRTLPVIMKNYNGLKMLEKLSKRIEASKMIRLLSESVILSGLSLLLFGFHPFPSWRKDSKLFRERSSFWAVWSKGQQMDLFAEICHFSKSNNRALQGILVNAFFTLRCFLIALECN